MQFLNATESQLPAVLRVVEEAKLAGVHVSAPFLGRALVQCSDEDSAARISRVLQHVRACAPKRPQPIV